MAFRSKKSRSKYSRRIFAVIFIFLLLAFFIYDGNTRIEVSEYNLYYADLPASFEGFRIVQLSDLHGTEFGRDNKNLVSAVRKAAPDIIAITGDFIDAPDQGAFMRILMRQLTEISPVYFVNGNHEWASKSLPELKEILAEYGVHYLSNDYEVIAKNGESIVIAGLEDPNGPYDMKPPKTVVSEIRAAEGRKHLILLAHRNNKTEVYETLGADTILCGHGHGGLIRLPGTDGLISPGQSLFPKNTSGVYQVGGADMVVSRGLGFSFAPRILNNPHIPVVILHKGNP